MRIIDKSEKQRSLIASVDAYTESLWDAGLTGITLRAVIPSYTKIALRQIFTLVKGTIVTNTHALGNKLDLKHGAPDAYTIAPSLAAEEGVLQGFTGWCEMYDSGSVPILRNDVIWTLPVGSSIGNAQNKVYYPINSLYTPLYPIDITITNNLDFSVNIFWSGSGFLESNHTGDTLGFYALLMAEFLVEQ
jgi:hypothetical protein